MALSCGRSVCMSLLRTLRMFGGVTSWSATRGLRSDAMRLKPVASVAATSPEPAHRLPVVEGSVVSSDDIEETRRVLESVNAQIAGNTTGRLFAIVFIHGKQFKVTAEDLVLVHADMPVDIGDSLRLEKVLMVGARDFTLLGRPLLDRGLVRVDATVVEKTLSQTKRNFICIRRSRYERHYFYRFSYTILRINSIELLRDVNAPAKGQDSSRSRLAY
ncbi:large ribosomal subunit protein bL21m [Dermacentor andersoni]|uniref:large ribosomal subunit protein bL21m n=1 Tax=Dermacentor andersoni TaxID=34620 RepID=UPI0024159938|nr:39S ribosomal protein L21, mitochondrial-like [Dermacentor andersoni]